MICGNGRHGFGSAGAARTGVGEAGAHARGDANGRTTSRRGLLKSATKAVTTSHRRRIGLALASVSLVLLLVLNPAAAQGQPSGRDGGLSELWRTYPLEPREGEARIRSGNESDQSQAPPPSLGNTQAGADTGRPPAVGDDSATGLALLLLAFSLIGLTVVVLGAQRAPAVGRHVRGSAARVGSVVVSPVRSPATAARPRPAGSALRPAPERTRALGLGRTGGKVMRLPVRVGTTMGATFRSASVGLLSKRGEILFYVLVAIASAAVGIGVTFLLTVD
jgi:hypothetical protein